jgi:quercetin dioxygenase-like cupin family protein
MDASELTPPLSPPDVLDDPCVVLLDGPLASAWDEAQAARALPPNVRRQLLARAAHSAAASAAFATVRRRHAAASLRDGTRVRSLYASSGNALRPGEPLCVQCVELAAGARWRPAPAGPGVQREWLVMRGDARLHDTAMRAEDYRIEPSGSPADAELTSARGALVYVRDDLGGSSRRALASISRAADARWEDYAPGIRRRMLWCDGAQGAFLFHALAGASVPTHRHRHDEECLMLEGELYIDDELLRAGDYQLAPAGTRHRSVETETGALIYAHGDVELDLIGG